MKALVLKRYGGPDQVVFADMTRPVPQPDEILVKVHAAGLNPIDNMIPKGTIRPVIDKAFPFDQAKEALAYLAKGRAKGKVVVEMK